MRVLERPMLLAMMVFLAGTSALAGYVHAQTTSTVVVQPLQRVYTYPEGRYELRGDGTATSPYFWVWIPSGVQTVPAPPGIPMAGQPIQQVFTYPEGRYELRGHGTAASPYHWVWIPAGVQVQAAAPPAPPLPSMSQPIQQVFTYPEGRYELRGHGTAASPYHWVWIPAGVQVQAVPSAPPLPMPGHPVQPVYTYPQGRYELRGHGTAASPYYWVWIPAGAQVQVIPPAPPLPMPGQPVQRVYTYPEGRYELRGDGTATSPYSWVWIPTPLPKYQFLPELKSAEGKIEYYDSWKRFITVNGTKFELPESFSMSNPPAIGQQVVVTYYVAQDGRNIVRSIDHNSAR